MGRMFDENALPAMLGSPCSTQAGVPTPTSAGIAGLATTGHRGPNLSAVARSYAPADLAHDPLERIVGPDASPMLFGEGVVRQGLWHGRLDQLGRLAEPHAVEPRDDLASFALSR